MERHVILDYVTAFSARGGGSASELGMRLGVSRSRASSWLGDLPARQVQTTRQGRAGEKRWFLSRDVKPDEALAARRRFNRVVGELRRHRRDGRTRRDEILAASERARLALADGDWALVARLLADPLLQPGVARRVVGSKWADEILAELWALRAGASMEAGRAAEAERLARFGLRRKANPESRLRTWGILGAALRMQGPARCPEAEAAYDAGIAETHRFGGAAGQRILRNLNASAVAPQIAMGRFARAESYLARAQAVRQEDDPAGVENDVRVAQLILARGADADAARRALEELDGRFDLPFFLAGWRARCEAGIVAASDGEPEAFNLALRRAWESNRGYEFQRRLVLARLASSGELYRPELWPRDVTKDARRHVAILHREEQNARLSDCRVCRQLPLPQKAAHALGMRELTLPASLAT